MGGLGKSQLLTTVATVVDGWELLSCWGVGALVALYALVVIGFMVPFDVLGWPLVHKKLGVKKE